MNYRPRPFRSSNLKAYLATLVSYLMLAGPLAPLAVAGPQGRGARPQPPSSTGAPAPQPQLSVSGDPNVGATPIITATKVDAFPDPNADGKADPGETITYTVTIQNTGTADATGVQFNDTVDPNTTLVAGSVQTQPLATNDTYSVLGNVRIQPNAAAGLLVNDFNPDTGSSAGLTASGPTTTAQGGNITINSDGSFSYNPKPGFEGADTVTYTVTGTGGKTDTATITFNVAGMIWFVNSAAGTNGDGRLTSPFNCLRGPGCFSTTTTGGAPDDPGDNIFLYASATSYTGGLTLKQNQKLIGQGASAATDLQTAAGVTLPANSDALPALNGNPGSVVITTSVVSTNGINLGAANSNTLRGFTVGATTGFKIASAASFGTLTVAEVALSGNGGALSLTSGALAANFTSIASTSSGAQGISLSSVSGSLASAGGTSISGSTTQCILVTGSTASLSFGNTTCTGGTDGISLQNNSGANVRTFGTLNVSGGSGIAFLHANGGGNTTVTGAASLASAGNPVDIQNAASGTNINFQGGATVSKTTAGGAGLNWGGTNTGATLTFATLALTTSNGPGLVAAGGGTINVTTGTGSSISATGGASQAAPAISANAVAFGASFATVSSSTSGNSGNGISLTNVTGTLTMSGGSISGAAGAAFLVSGGTANVTYNGTVSQSNAQRVVNVASATGGTIAFGGAVSASSTSTGILLNNNAGATINFTGGLSLSTGANDAFTATGAGPAATTGGTINVTQNNSTIVNTITTTTGTALKVQNTTIGSSGITFRSITSNGAGGANNGIILDNTGTTAGLTVSANGGTCTSAATCTGGQIATKTTGANGSTTQGTGIYLNSTVGVSLDRMQLNDFANYAIKGTSVTGFSLTNSVINGTNGNNNAGGVEETCIRFDNLLTSASFPTAQVNNNTISGGFTENIRVMNTSGTLDRLNVNNNAFGLISTTGGNDNFHMEATGNGTIAKVTLTGNTFAGTRGDFIETIANTNSTMDTVVRTNKFTNGQAIIPGGGTSVSIRGDSLGSAATHTFDISCNRLVGGYDTVGMFVAKGNGGGTFSGTIVNNVIGPATSGSNADGLFVRAAGSGSLSTLVQNNQISGHTSAAMHFQNNDGSSTMNLSIFGNTVSSPAGFAFSGLFLDNGGTASDTSQMNVVVGSATNAAQKNDFSTGDPSNASDISINNNFASTTLRLSKNGSASTTATNVLKDDNLNGAATSVTEAGTITLVTTLPSTPAAPATCSVPAQPATDVTPVDEAPAPLPSVQTTSASTSQRAVATSSNNVTSRPFVSLPRNVTPAAPQPLVPATTHQTARTQTSTTAPASSTTAPVPVVNVGGGSVSVNIGTLRAGDSVTITFQVTVNNPYSGGPNVSNQGTVSGTNFSNVLTDDPAGAGSADPTLTPINVVNIAARDAQAAEPATGTAPMLFTVVLSGAAPASGVSVSYATADGGATPATGGASCATSGVDYEATSGTLNFASGERVKTVSVNICGDGVSEPDETLLLNLSSAVGGIITRAQATGTITANNPPGTFIVSELRTSGPAGPGDDFVELYNNTSSPLTVTASDASAGYGVFKMGTDCNAAPVLVATIPNSTVIPAKGHYLLVGSQYSLGSYAAGDQTLTADLENDANLAVFSTADVNNLSTQTRLDAVGFGTNTGNVCDLLREGTTLPPVSGSTTEHSFFRKECDFVAGVGCTTNGAVKDSNDNSADFLFADTQGTSISGIQQRLGAPGPQNKTSPIRRDATIGMSLLDASQASTSAPNRVRDFTSDPANNSTFGTLSIRRRVTNSTGAAVTRLRFRIVEMTTYPSAGSGIADLRARSSTPVVVSGIMDTGTCATTGTPTTFPCQVTVLGTTLEQPPNQSNGGGYNSTLAAGTITAATPLAAGASIDLQFLLGVQQTGTFRFLIVVEALP